jgi:hypothetical protein
MSSIGCPECTSMLCPCAGDWAGSRADPLAILGAVFATALDPDGFPVAGGEACEGEGASDVEEERWRYVGFVSHENVL